MAVNHIAINRNVRLGGKLARAHDNLDDAVNGLRELRDAMNACIDTTPDPDDYSYLETQFGIPSGKGYDCWYQTDGLVNAFADNGSQSSLQDKLNQFLTYLA